MDLQEVTMKRRRKKRILWLKKN